MITGTNIHGHSCWQGCAVSCNAEGEGTALNVTVVDRDGGSHEISIYHKGDLRFLQEVRAKINAKITEFVATNGKETV